MIECAHDWKEVYYGYECVRCKAFVPFGLEPWAYLDDDERDELELDDVDE